MLYTVTPHKFYKINNACHYSSYGQSGDDQSMIPPVYRSGAARLEAGRSARRREVCLERSVTTSDRRRLHAVFQFPVPPTEARTDRQTDEPLQRRELASGAPHLTSPRLARRRPPIARICRGCRPSLVVMGYLRTTTPRNQ